MPWVKGQSGNPNGKPKRHAELRQLIVNLMPDAMKRLKELVHSEDQKVSIEAVKLIAAYSVGKPPEPGTVAHMEAVETRREALVEATKPQAIPATVVVEAVVAPPVVQDIASGPEGLRCLYRGQEGKCGALAATGTQWCAEHKAKLFASLNAK